MPSALRRFAPNQSGRLRRLTMSESQPHSEKPAAPASSSAQRHRRAAEELLLEALASGETVRIAVRGSCMEPLLLDGDRVQVVPLDKPLAPGLLALARDGSDQLVCHRVLAVDDSGVVLAGDRSFRVEQHRPETLLGRVVGARRGSRDLVLPHRPWLDGLLARWHHRSWRLLGTLSGRLLEAPRWRLVAGRARWAWRAHSRLGS